MNPNFSIANLDTTTPYKLRASILINKILVITSSKEDKWNEEDTEHTTLLNKIINSLIQTIVLAYQPIFDPKQFLQIDAQKLAGSDEDLIKFLEKILEIAQNKSTSYEGFAELLRLRDSLPKASLLRLTIDLTYHLEIYNCQKIRSLSFLYTQRLLSDGCIDFNELVSLEGNNQAYFIKDFINPRLRPILEQYGFKEVLIVS